jgi:ABC-type branched-subunit amino acid transport system substrate-binding protein
MRRREFIVLGSLSLVATPSWAVEPTPLVGFLAPLTGPYRALGRQMVDAAQMAATEQNAILLVEDTLGEPEGALKAVDRLLERKAQIAVGPVGVRESVTAAGWTSRNALPLISLCSDPSLVSGPLVSRWRLSPFEQAQQLASLVGGQRAAILSPENEYGRGATEGFIGAWKSAGREVACTAFYSDEKPDFRRALDELTGTRKFIGVGKSIADKKADKFGYVTTGQPRRVDFDVLFIPDFHTRVSRILGYLSTVGIQDGDGGAGLAVQLLGLGGWRGKAMELTGAKASGALILDTFGGVDDGGRAEEFDRAFEAATSRRVTSFEAEVFDAVYLAAAAVRKRPEAVHLALRSMIPWTGVAGQVGKAADGSMKRVGRLYRFDIDGHVVPVG